MAGLRRWRVSVSALAVLLACGAALAEADTLRLKDGRVFEGKLISRDAKKIVFRVEKDGKSYVQGFDAAEVDTITEDSSSGEPSKDKPSGQAKPPPERRTGTGTPYYVLPIRGVFGLHVSTAVVAECYQTARELGAKVVILEIDSPGGAVSELKSILKILDRYHDIRTVAYVKDAKSAAAILAVACPDIVMSETGKIGAAVPYVRTPEGTPKNIDEKMQSSIRADFRSAAQSGGHNDLLVRGMMETDIVLGLKGSGKNAKVVEGNGDKVIKPKGQILTLTTQEAIECGLVLGSARRIADCRELLKIEQWYDVTDHGRERVSAWIKEIEEALEKYKAASQRVETACTEAAAFAQAGKRTDCTNALRRAENNLRRMEELGDKYPGLGDGDTSKHFRERIKAVRQAIEKRP